MGDIPLFSQSDTPNGLTARQKTNREQVGREPSLGMPEDLLMIPKLAWAGTQTCENPAVDLLVNGAFQCCDGL